MNGKLREKVLLIEIINQPSIYLWLGRISCAFLAYNKSKDLVKCPSHSIKYCLASKWNAKL